jgi:NADH-quinone oxidoreductase subunit L
MHHAHESPPVMLVPLFVLAAGALLAGVIFKEYFFGHHYAEFWGSALFTLPDNKIVEEFHHVPLWVKLSPFVAMLLGLVTAWFFYIRSPGTPKRLAEDHNRMLYQFLLNKWYFDELYDFIFVRPAKWLGSVPVEAGRWPVIDGYGPDGIAARVPGHHRPGCQTADRISLPLRLRDADRNCSACHMDDARECI